MGRRRVNPRRQTDQGALRTVIDFVRASLTRATLHRWQFEIGEAFIAPGVGPIAGVWPVPTSASYDLSLRQLRQLQTAAGVLLDQVVDSRTDPRLRIAWVTMGRGRLRASMRSLQGRVSPVVEGTAADIFRYVLLRVLERVAVDSLYRCPNPTCRRLFIKNGRREYCSTRCQGAVYMRAYRA